MSPDCCQARRHVGAHHCAVDHDIDIMLVFLVERGCVCNLVELPVNLDALKALLS